MQNKDKTMEKIAVIAISLIAGMALAQNVASPTNAVKKTSMREKTGGAIVRPLPENSKAIVILDSTGGKDVSPLAQAFERRLEMMTSLNTKVVSAPVASYDNKEQSVVIALVPSGDLSIVPNKKMAIVPASESEDETVKEMWKATVSLFSWMGKAPNDFMGMGIVNSGAEALGIPQIQKVFYVKALEEGWAPEPKDEYQKKLWDEYQAKKAAAEKK